MLDSDFGTLTCSHNTDIFAIHPSCNLTAQLDSHQLSYTKDAKEKTREKIKERNKIQKLQTINQKIHKIPVGFDGRGK